MDYSVLLNQGFLPSQGSSGTVMSAPGQREDGRQTKEGRDKRREEVERGSHRGIDKEDLQR